MKFEFDNNAPIYIQLVEQLKNNIISGTLGVGERLPSVRELALQTKVNPNTMQKALIELDTKKNKKNNYRLIILIVCIALV